MPTASTCQLTALATATEHPASPACFPQHSAPNTTPTKTLQQPHRTGMKSRTTCSLQGPDHPSCSTSLHAPARTPLSRLTCQANAPGSGGRLEPAARHVGPAPGTSQHSPGDSTEWEPTVEDAGSGQGPTCCKAKRKWRGRDRTGGHWVTTAQPTSP